MKKTAITLAALCIFSAGSIAQAPSKDWPLASKLDSRPSFQPAQQRLYASPSADVQMGNAAAIMGGGNQKVANSLQGINSTSDALEKTVAQPVNTEKKEPLNEKNTELQKSLSQHYISSKKVKNTKNLPQKAVRMAEPARKDGKTDAAGIQPQKTIVVAQAKNPPASQSEPPLIPFASPTPKLPTLGDVSSQDPRQARVVRMRDGVNEVIYMSSTMPNRIATPFAKPKVIDVNTVDWKAVGQDVYIVPKGKEPSGIFIADENSGSAVASITVVPKDVIGQNIILTLDSPTNLQIGASKELKDNASDYLDQVKVLMKMAVLGQTPPGFTESPLNVGVVRIERALVTPIKQISGQTLDFFVYNVQSASSSPIELQESSFFVDGVRSVAFWPNIILMPKETTKVYILMEKSGGQK